MGHWSSAVFLFIFCLSSVSCKSSIEKVPEDSRLCLSQGCIKAAAYLLDSIDFTKKPCDNFYDYACGKWMKNNAIPEDKSRLNIFIKLDERIKQIMRQLLEEGPNVTTSTNIDLTRNLYKRCMDIKSVDALRSTPLNPFLKSVGGWPLIEPGWKDANIDFSKLMGRIFDEFTMETFISVQVGADVKNVTNNIITFDQPELGLGRGSRSYYLNDTAYKKQVGAYKRKIFAFAKLLAEDLKISKVGGDALKKGIEEMFEFERKLANITVPEEDRRNYTMLYNKWTLKQFEETMKILNVDTFMSLILPQEVYARLISENKNKYQIIVTQPDFFNQLNSLLSETPKRVLVNFMVWKVLVGFGQVLDTRYEDADQDFKLAVVGRQQKPARWKTCMGQASMMDMAYGAMYVREYFGKNDKAEAMEMIANLKDAFREILQNLDWMAESTKDIAIEKVGFIIDKIGFPDYVMNDTTLDDYYKNLTVSDEKSTTYYETFVSILRWYNRKELFNLLKDFDRTRFLVSPAMVNAIYSPDKNSITFPAGILQPPFFESTYPKYINYGAMGSVIGHEMTHGFDDSGAQFDKLGNLKNWWDSNSEAKFVGKTKCMIDQYGSYTVPEINMKVNGKLTQGENIADNGGLKQAFRAYKRYLKKLGNEEPRLPALNMTNEQVFFVSFSQFWCSKSTTGTKITQILTDPHSPSIFRVNGVMSNSAEFSQVFNCPIGSIMNPKLKCAVW